MKKKLINALCAFAATIMLLEIVPYNVNAIENENIAMENQQECTNNVQRYSTYDEGKANDVKVPQGKLEISDEASSYAVQANYTMADLNKMSFDELVNTITSIDWWQITDLFKYNAGAYEFYSNMARYDALVKALEVRGAQYTASDNKGIVTLVEVLRAGHYLGFYYEDLKIQNERSVHDKCLPGIRAIQGNPNYKFGEDGQNQVLEALGRLIGNGSCDNDIINKTTPIIMDFYNNLEEYCKVYSKGNAAYELIKGIEFDVTTYLYIDNIQPKDTPFFGKIDGFIDAVSKLGLIGNFTDRSEWVINNGIYYTGRLGAYYSDPTAQLRNLEKCMEIHSYLGEQYMTAVKRVVYDYNSTLSNGQRIDYDKIISDGKSLYLPRTYTFDDGKLIIKAGDKISEEKIKRLYWASKEVKAQFFRILGNDKPLEIGNTDDVLTMVIYNSPQEYKMNSILYNLSTDNGGMYIEGDGAFYTYERTEADSIYSLEELFRHEYTHYLQGRYLVPGLWGTSDFYQGNPYRLTWFEEGSAEFFAGATRKEDVKARKSIVGGLSSDPSMRFNTEKLFNSQYGSWDFYNYGFAFTDYMYSDRKEILYNMMRYIERNDVIGYERYIKELAQDSNINTQYQNHMQKLVDNYPNLDVPLVADDYVQPHSKKNLEEIKNEIVRVTGIQNATIIEEKGQFGSTFTVKGKFVGDTTTNVIDDWKSMNLKANEMLNRMDTLNWTGYKTVTNYFTNYQVNDSKRYEFDVVFTGISNDNIVSFSRSDVNTDGNVDLLDLSTVAVRYNKSKGDNSYNTFADSNLDGIIDLFDLVIVSKEIQK